MFCEECGKTIVRPQAKFCPYCGHKIDHQPIVNAAQPAPAQAVQMPEISGAAPIETAADAVQQFPGSQSQQIQPTGQTQKPEVMASMTISEVSNEVPEPHLTEEAPTEPETTYSPEPSEAPVPEEVPEPHLTEVAPVESVPECLPENEPSEAETTDMSNDASDANADMQPFEPEFEDFSASQPTENETTESSTSEIHNEPSQPVTPAEPEPEEEYTSTASAFTDFELEEIQRNLKKKITPEPVFDKEKLAAELYNNLYENLYENLKENIKREVLKELEEERKDSAGAKKTGFFKRH